MGCIVDCAHCKEIWDGETHWRSSWRVVACGGLYEPEMQMHIREILNWVPFKPATRLIIKYVHEVSVCMINRWKPFMQPHIHLCLHACYGYRKISFQHCIWWIEYKVSICEWLLMQCPHLGHLRPYQTPTMRSMSVKHGYGCPPERGNWGVILSKSCSSKLRKPSSVRLMTKYSLIRTPPYKNMMINLKISLNPKISSKSSTFCLKNNFM